MKNIIMLGVALLVIIGGYFIIKNNSNTVDVVNKEPVVVIPNQNTGTPTTTPDTEDVDDTKTVVGTSVEGNPITAFHFGNGDTNILFVGGIHGGYEWNTTLLAYELMDYAAENPEWIPENVRLTVIPTLNPDGLEKVTGTTERFTKADVSADESVVTSGRFNAHTVDLNRNFDCDWNASGTWQNKKVSGGTSAFSEPESAAIRDYVLGNKPDAVVVWYSAAGGVYSSSCHNGVLGETETLTGLYANASGYKGYKDFDYYEITGDMVNWLAKEKIPAISVLLTNHTDTEWNKNKAGIEAVLNEYKD